MNLKIFIPWQAKIAAKLVLSRLPLNYKFWKRLGLFVHGHMEQLEYAHGVFRKHFDRVAFGRKEDGFVALELGPGDSLFSALLASAFGSSLTYLVDVGSYAKREMAPYRAMLDYLVNNGFPVSGLSSISSLNELLEACNARYEVGGLASLRKIPDRSVDFIWSQAVSEHIRKDAFLDTMRELRRVLQNDGVSSHCVDFKDHLGGALNNLRFPKLLWEQDAIANAGFYTNRIRYSEMIQLFQQAGFDVEVLEVKRWEGLPTPRSRLAAEFQHWDDEELRISGFDAVLRPRPDRTGGGNVP